MKLKFFYAVSLAFAALSVSACTPAVAPTAASSSNPSPIVSSIPRPSAAQTASLVTELGKINPAFNERYVERARNTCNDILSGKEESVILANTIQRFHGGNRPPLTEEQGQQIISVVKANGFCVKP